MFRAGFIGTLAFLATGCVAHGQTTQAITAPPPTVTTSGGPALVSGRQGTTSTVMLPGSAAGGTVVNTGTGSGLLIVPGKAPEPVFIPK